ncbi:helix-turn-helix domain-containing protein [Nesterenkonia halotolerans]|uniref:Transcriptional regulator with XRE-family HTH domain n=1 Tax=Nesterenkonia halotolerans TaxID=225325 RepID=A0ABR9J614_9MICC|nr:helix-turn-helix transcriptional regulator [Nesterenkonia halotolerans]MBE1514287.1 transcriptional regulator with XRE-family HTH domain [Nesterenkonia halotolerans]
MAEMRNVRDVGLMIRDARRTAGLTQLELSKLAHVSRRWLIGIETGAIDGPDATKLFDVVRALGLTFSIGPPQPPRRSPNKATAAALRLMKERRQ